MTDPDRTIEPDGSSENGSSKDGGSADWLSADWLSADSGWAGRWLGPCCVPRRVGTSFAQALRPRAELPHGARVVHLGGTILGPLLDAHVHSDLVDLRAVRRGGIASVRDLGGVPERVAARARTARDARSGLPAVAFAGPFLTAPGGYPSDRAWAPPGSWREVRSAADARAAVAERLAEGAGLVKVALNVEAGPTPTPPVLAALVDAAHEAGLLVVAHAQGVGAVESALDGGADELAHVPWTHALDAGVLRAAAQWTTWVSTLAIHAGSRRGPLATATANLRGFLESGGQVAYGTDLGNGPLALGVNPVEIRRLQAAGLGVDDVLLAITADPPSLTVVSHVPGGLDRDPERFADSLAGARVVAL